MTTAPHMREVTVPLALVAAPVKGTVLLMMLLPRGMPPLKLVAFGALVELGTVNTAVAVVTRVDVPPRMMVVEELEAGLHGVAIPLTVDEIVGPVTVEELVKPPMVVDGADPFPKDKVDGRVVVEELTNPLAVVEVADPLLKPEVDGRISVEELPNPLAVVEAADPLVVDEVKSTVVVEELVDPSAVVEAADPLVVDEVDVPSSSAEEVANDVPVVVAVELRNCETREAS